MDGELIPYKEATFHIITPSLHYGAGIFESIRCYQTPQGPAAFRLQDHLERFLESIRILGVHGFQYSVEQIQQFGDGKPGPVTQYLLRIYIEIVHGRSIRSKE